ncbi:MAG TPA: TonB-dependent receptor plug domain-containing protein, partial [Longimicrobiaceae bacterium]|nr:TonB-dependent receptor plug domain-containing protein [Longimicrobiaceae bacterium]
MRRSPEQPVPWWITVPVLAVLGSVGSVAAQQATGAIELRVLTAAAGEPVDGAEVRVGEIGSLTSETGTARLEVPAGEHTVRVRKIGFAEAAARVTVSVDRTTAVLMRLEIAAAEVEGIVVTTTRTERRVEDEPVRVEVLGREEIEEKLLMTPGDIAMMLNETSGLRVQSTSPSLGGANVRIQGLRGRYTQILSDGLPLYGGQTGSLSMLQIPPMDLGQVEVIKGAASALYGSTALGGVVNLISRRPADGEREVLVNRSTLGGTDGVAWISDRIGERWGYTFLGGAHYQSQADVDSDGWVDLAGYRRLVGRPRIFWDDGAGRSLFVTVGGTVEAREGGTREGTTTPAGSFHPEALDTRRGDIGMLGRFLLAGEKLLTVRGSGMRQRHEHLFGDTDERDRHANGFAELTYAGTAGPHSWLLGVAIQHETYSAEDVAGFDFTHTAPALFVQDEYAPIDWLTIAASARLDRHSEYGVFGNPRLSILLRPGGRWSVRASAGTGYYAPTPFTEETEAVGLRRLLP